MASLIDQMGSATRLSGLLDERILDLPDRLLNGHKRDSDAILQSLPVAVYTTDAAGRITFYNEAAAQLWGYGRNSGKANSAARGKCIGPTARLCRMTNARWL